MENWTSSRTAVICSGDRNSAVTSLMKSNRNVCLLHDPWSPMWLSCLKLVFVMLGNQIRPRWKHAEQGIPDVPLTGEVGQNLPGKPEAFPGQMRVKILPVNSGCTLDLPCVQVSTGRKHLEEGVILIRWLLWLILTCPGTDSTLSCLLSSILLTLSPRLSPPTLQRKNSFQTLVATWIKYIWTPSLGSNSLPIWREQSIVPGKEHP